MKIGQIGIGELGKAVASNMLKAGHELTVHDLSKHTAGPILEQGASWSDSTGDLAAESEVMLTVLPTPAIIEGVMGGANGVLEAMAPGSVWIEHSTNDSDVLQRLQSQAGQRGIDIIEAPVTGGIPLAHEGSITVLAGAQTAVFEKYKHLLAIVGDPVLHIGPVGSASILKVITNMMALTHLWMMGESLMLAKRAGIDVGAAYEAYKASCGNSFTLETEGPPILNGSYDYGFTLALANKDMRLVEAIAQEHGVPLEMGKVTFDLFQKAEEKYGPKFWSTGVVKLLEDQLSTDLRSDGYEPEARW
jgi:3-hydroxyisobutyrate dehydrogenase